MSWKSDVPSSTVTDNAKKAWDPIVPESVTPSGTAFKWPGGNVYYRFDPTQVSNSTITAAKMQQFRDSVAEWAAFANLHFIENITGQPNFITVQENTSGGEGGFSSSVGMAGGEQFIQIGAHSWNRGTLCHEVGHALGLYHEMQRSDRDTYVIINFGNIAPSDQPNFTILPGGSNTLQGPYDFYSVMHYSRNALSDNGGDTISMQSGFTQFINIIGNVADRTLSKLDRAGMAQIYGNPSVAPSALVTNTNDSGPGSLRSAIYYAFDLSPTASPAPVTPTPTTIAFQIPNTDPNFNGQVYTIKPSFVMTAPGDGTTIDATTQTAFNGDTNTSGPEVVLDGSNQATYEFAGVFGPAFILRQANCVIKGFVIHSYDEQGISLTSDPNSGSVATGNVVSGCFIGTDPTGTTAIGNGTFASVELLGGANNNVIGGTKAAARNVISGSTSYGISMHDSGTNNNTVEGNYIGVNAAGTGALSNAVAGVEILGGAQNNIIGGTTSGARNIISGNKQQGVVILDSGTNGNVVEGNYIGLNMSGTAAIPNGVFDQANDIFYAGIDIFGGAQNTVIGGTATGAGNVISGNAGPGMTVSEANTNGTLIQGNFIGTDPTGMSAIGNGFADSPNQFIFGGVELFGSPQSTMIGGTAPGAGNLISGNGAQGVYISDTGTTLNVVQGNIIGLNAPGTAALGNGFSGVGIFTGAVSNTIGGTTAAARNVISGNLNQGILLSGTGVSQNTIAGNYIGTDLSGTVARPNAFSGIGVFGGASSNTVGGTAEGVRNVIAGNASDGITFSGSGVSLNNVQGNFIGLNASGTSALTNNGNGVSIFGAATNNVIGGTTAGVRNYISGNTGAGVLIANSGTTGNQVQGNTIGLNFAGTAAGNGNHGVSIFNGAQFNLIGGSATGASNMISANTNGGIAMSDSTDIKDTFSRNTIFANGAKGIALFNGANNSQPFPTLNTAVLSTVGNPSGTDVSGSLTAGASATYTIEFFASPTADGSGFGEGQFFLGSASVTTNAGGTVSFTTSLGVTVPAGYVIAATATDAVGNTSEFSADRTVTTTDTDGDGVPDNWMLAHFGHATGQAGDKSRATDDADGSGMTNLQKFMAGLDPNNPNSFLRITSVARSSGNVMVGFPSVSGKVYQLQYRDDLVAGNWSPLVDGILGTGATLQITDPSSTGLTKRFYRIALQP